MFGVGGFEIFVIIVFAFLIFGPDKLPEAASTIGKFIARFRDAQKEAEEFRDEIYDPNSDEPFKNPLEAIDRMAQKQEAREAAAAGHGAPAAGAAATATAGVAAGTAAAAAEKPKAGSTVTERREAARKAAAANAAASAAASAAEPTEPAQPAQRETFAERRARYERERAEREAAADQAPAGDAEPTPFEAPAAEGGDA